MPGINIRDETYEYIKKLIENPIIKAKYPTLTSVTRFIESATVDYISKVEEIIKKSELIKK